MGKQLTNDGLLADQVRKKKGQLNALQAAQLNDCLNAGMTPPKVRRFKEGQAKKAAPLFEQPAEMQASLF
jgi:hypothetical protein